jgi:hypothetical protein
MLSFLSEVCNHRRSALPVWHLPNRAAFHNAMLSHVAILFRSVVVAIPPAALVARWSFISLGRKIVISIAHQISLEGDNGPFIPYLITLDQIDCFWHSSHAKFDVAEAPTQSSEILAGLGEGGGFFTLKKSYRGLAMIGIWILCFRYAGSYAYEQVFETRFVKCST